MISPETIGEGQYMYHIGEILIYGAHGACRVVEHAYSQTGGKPVTYLVLEPLGQTGAR